MKYLGQYIKWIYERKEYNLPNFYGKYKSKAMKAYVKVKKKELYKVLEQMNINKKLE